MLLKETREFCPGETKYKSKKEMVMDKVKKDFIQKELSRFGILALVFAVCFLVLLRFASNLAPYQPLLLLGMAAIIALGALRSLVLAHSAMGNLTGHDTYLLDKEYTAPHPVYKVWQGEIHLMQSFIVCRNRGRLLFIPIHNMERVECRFNRTAMGKVPFAKFIMDTGKTFTIDFLPNRPKESQAIFEWITKRLGKEKVIVF